MRREVRLSGFGGQGIVLAGRILGKAAAIYDDLQATFIQSYGPEARGGACAAEVVIDSKPVHHPHIVDPELLVVMSQGAYTRYVPGFRRDGLMIVDSDLVELDNAAEGLRILSIPATRIAEELGRRVVANIVMLGYVAAVTDLVSVEAVRQSVLTSIPQGTEELNMKAFQSGLDYPKVTGQTVASSIKSRAEE